MKSNRILIFEIEDCECSMEAVKNAERPFELSATGNQSPWFENNGSLTGPNVG
jgi:hypothetical protein